MELLEKMEYVEDIPEGWKWVKLGELLNYGLFELLDRYRIPLSDNQRNKMKDGILYPYYGANGIIDYVNRYIFDGEFILVAEDGTVSTDKGKPVVQYVCGKFWVSNHAHVIKCENSVTLKFLYYALKNVDIIPYITGAVQPKLNQRNLLDIEILYALDINEQKAIAEVLSSIDDKIELLHCQNKTLEEMAMTLFRQWFIEPTKDGLPDGWEEVSLGDVFDIGIGRTPPRKESYWFSLNPKDIRWVSVKDLGSIDTYIINTSEFLKEEAVKKFNIPIIPDNTVLLSFKLTVGRIGITIGEMVSNEAIAHFKLKPNSKISSNYLYLFLKTLDFSTFGSTSSIAEAINSKIIKEIKIQIPDDELILSFQRLIDPIFQKIRYNTFQIQTLEKLRNTLLPKLMSGEVRIKV